MSCPAFLRALGRAAPGVGACVAAARKSAIAAQPALGADGRRAGVGAGCAGADSVHARHQRHPQGQDGAAGAVGDV